VQAATMEKRLEAIEKDQNQSEKLLEDVLTNIEDTSLMCEFLFTRHVTHSNTAATSHLESYIIQYLEKTPAASRQILKYLMEIEKKTPLKIDPTLADLSRHSVNSCLYHLLNKKCVKKTDAMPPVWSIN